MFTFVVWQGVLSERRQKLSLRFIIHVRNFISQTDPVLNIAIEEINVICHGSLTVF